VPFPPRYLYDEGDMMVSAFAKTDDGAFKECVV